MRSDDLYLVDLIEAAEDIERLLQDRDFPRFARDDQFRSAVLWKLFIISEASTKLSVASRDHLKNIAWDEIRGFRNRLAHGYFTLKWDRVWDIARNQASPLKTQAEQVLAKEFPNTYQQLVARRLRGVDPADQKRT